MDVRSAGTAEDADVSVTQELLDWADVIFIMEEAWQLCDLERRFPKMCVKKKIISLNLADIYDFMSPELVRLLKLRVEYQLRLLGEAK